MKVKIKDTWHDSDRQPILIRLTEEEKKYLAKENVTDLCVFPDGTPTEAVKVFMGAVENSTFELHGV